MRNILTIIDMINGMIASQDFDGINFLLMECITDADDLSEFEAKSILCVVRPFASDLENWYDFYKVFAKPKK